MASRTHYEVLGVEPSADAEAVEKAYRRRVRRVHPDVSDGADTLEQFYAIQRAYDVLRDPERRGAYDDQLAAAAAPTPSPSQSVAATSPASRQPAAPIAGPQWWDPAQNPTLRKRLLKSRRKKWLARLETLLLTVNVALGVGLGVEAWVMWPRHRQELAAMQQGEDGAFDSSGERELPGLDVDLLPGSPIRTAREPVGVPEDLQLQWRGEGDLDAGAWHNLGAGSSND